jgi:hypothetical protein
MAIKLLGILKDILKEEYDASSNVSDALNRFKVLKLVLQDLLTAKAQDEYSREDDLEKLISDIEVIVFKPTTFQITFKNGSKMNLKYDPTPRELQNSKEYKARDFFQCQIMGKKYNLGNRSEYLQALDYIGKALSEKPIGSTNNQTDNSTDQELPDEEPETNDEDNGEDEEG